ncbi:Multidrug resistance protein MdtE precursor [Methyloligella halotolerans]|uniref:Multidrug resistance protein MdtE n=1 Tax=Methyloligella halotolerans TaxID=1177755 RepID=A0A1E2RY58_9HYPH|nr:efflux RND transporter periplasmic adaptor subunit [Methyloligella halotolerans]ODA67151.1 Multidrug resistance protein MdtE precursor [Methyloligella halotolerans]
MTRAYSVALMLFVLMFGALFAATSHAWADDGDTAAADRTETSATSPENEPAGLSVLVTPVARQSVDHRVTATGTVAAWREMPIGAEISGLAVIAVDADEGDRVKKGQRLAKLNDALLKAQLAQQKAAIAEAEAALANSQSDLDRANRMSKGILSEQTKDERATLVKTNAAKLDAAKAQLDQLQAQLDQTEILSPTDAVVADRSITLGQVVSSGNELFRLIRDGRLEVAARIAEADLAAVQPGQTVSVIGPSGGRYEGKIRLVAERVDEATRLGTAYVALPPGTPLKMGMFARVEIETGSQVAIAVPQKALVWRDGKAGAFVVEEDGRVVFTPVTITRQAGDAVEISQGLELGQRIVVNGAGLLSDGDRVRAKLAAAGEAEGITP